MYLISCVCSLLYIYIIPIRQSYPIGDTCRQPTRHGMPHRNRPVNNSAIIRTTALPLILPKIIPSLSCVRARSIISR